MLRGFYIKRVDLLFTGWKIGVSGWGGGLRDDIFGHGTYLYICLGI